MNESDDPTIDDGATSTNETFDGSERTAAEAILGSLSAHGVDCLFSNLGTDHTPILEAAGRIRRRGGSMPESVVCPHEFVAISAAHGHAAVSGEPQAVIVHVDVGTQNLGCGMHNAMRANVPIFVMAGLAPVSERGVGSRTIGTQYKQDVFDQAGIVDDYCTWYEEYRVPADPDAVVARGLTRARAQPRGVAYLSAAREAWEAPVEPTDRDRSVDPVRPAGPDKERVAEVVDLVEQAEAPAVITSKVGAAPREKAGVDALVAFAEAAGAAVVEHIPTTLSFPRTHDLHLGFEPANVFDRADLVILSGTDIPWVPAKGSPRDDATVLQVDVDPTKSTFPHWDFRVDYAVDADPVRTLAAVADRLDPSDGEAARETWTAARREREAAIEDELRAAERDGSLTPAVVSSALEEVVDSDTIVVDGAVTSSGAIHDHLKLTEPGSFHAKYGAGLGWAVPAAVGAKIAAPEKRVIATVGDGSYMYGHPLASAWLSASQNAPTMTVVYNNSGWNAVKSATTRQHPSGESVADGVPESRFDPPFDLAIPATMVDAETMTVRTRDELQGALERAADATDSGTPAVVDVKIEPI